jgi:hypothetical protein
VAPERGVAASFIGPGQRRERLDVVRIGEQAPLRQLDHLPDVVETTMELHEDVTKDVLLFPAAAAHGMQVLDRRSHESYGGVEIAPDDRCAVGSWGGRRLRMAGYVPGPGPTRGASGAGGG